MRSFKFQVSSFKPVQKVAGVLFCWLVFAGLAAAIPAAAQVGPIVPSSCAQSPQGCGLNDLFQTIINVTQIILALTGSAALLMFAYGGAKFIMAAGNQEGITKGREILKSAVIGIVVILLSWVIVNFTILAITNGEVGGTAAIFGGQNPFQNPGQ